MDRAGPHTRTMASYAAAFDSERLTPQLIGRAREIVLDTIGAVLLGSLPQYAGIRILAGLAPAPTAADGCTVFGTGLRAPYLDALLANGAMGYAADAEGAARSLEDLYKKWASDGLVDTIEAFQFPVASAVNEILRLVGSLDDNR